MVSRKIMKYYNFDYEKPPLNTPCLFASHTDFIDLGKWMCRVKFAMGLMKNNNEIVIDMISGFEIDTQNYKYWITLDELDSGLTEGMKEN